jgi:sterol desaturase/sphingolipid hydroxylase (fatty acid hydroxylase superfamily)
MGADGLTDGEYRAGLIVSLVVLCLSMLEGVVYVARGRSYDFRSAGTSVLLAIGRRAVDRAPLWLALPCAALFYEHRLFDLPEDAWWTWPILLLGVDLAHYVSHRASHRIAWLWASHAVHHTSTELTLAAAYRLGWTGRLTLALASFSPLALLGFQPARIVGVYTLTLVYQVWIHAAWIPSLGPLEGIFNTPSAHRVHHANALAYRDKNFGGMLVIFDRLFGTYAPEDPAIATTYGWVTREQAGRPGFVLVEPYRRLWQRVRAASGMRGLAVALFGAPD